MTFPDINKLLTPVKRKIFLLIGRAILTAVDNSEKTMKIQVTGLSDETITGIERFQEYGFESYPKIDSEAEVVVGFINGNRDQGIALCIHDRAYRPTDLSEGDVRVYNAAGSTMKLIGALLKLQATGSEQPACLGDDTETVFNDILTQLKQLVTDLNTFATTQSAVSVGVLAPLKPGYTALIAALGLITTALNLIVPSIIKSSKVELE